MYLDETVDRESQQKLYVQILSIIRGKIEKGEWSTGDRIPTEVELCNQYSVSKATVRIAISELVRNGFLNRWQGKGTFVASPMQHIGMAMKTRLTEDMFGEGVMARKEVLVKGVNEQPEEMRKILRSEDEIYYFLCKRMVDDEPACLEETYLPLSMFPGIEQEDISQTSFYDLIQKNSIKRVSKVVQNIELSRIEGRSARILKVMEGTPALLLHRLLLCSDGSPIAYTRFYGNGNRYRIQTEFERIR